MVLPAQCGALGGEDFLQAGLGEIDELVELGAGVGSLLRRGLRFHQSAAGGHHYVHVDFGLGILFVAEVEERSAADEAHGGGGHQLPERRLLERPGGDQGVQRDGESHGGAGDGRGAGATIGLDDVAIEDDGALAESLEVDRGAEAAADEALNFVGTPADASALAFAGGAGDGGAGEHGVLCGDPAAAGIAQPAGNALLYGGAYQDAGVAESDKDRAFGGLDEAGGEGERAKLGFGAAAGAEEGGGRVHKGNCKGAGRGSGFRMGKSAETETLA